MNAVEKKILMEKFKQGQCSESELRLLRECSASDAAIRELLDFGIAMKDKNQMMSEHEILKKVKELNGQSRRSGRREGLMGE